MIISEEEEAYRENKLSEIYDYIGRLHNQYYMDTNGYAKILQLADAMTPLQFLVVGDVITHVRNYSPIVQQQRNWALNKIEELRTKYEEKITELYKQMPWQVSPPNPITMYHLRELIKSSA